MVVEGEAGQLEKLDEDCHDGHEDGLLFFHQESGDHHVEAVFEVELHLVGESRVAVQVEFLFAGHDIYIYIYYCLMLKPSIFFSLSF